MTLPPEYTGAWRRESIAIGGSPASEPQQVWWLQTPLFFADLRLPLVPGAGAESFSGTTTLSAGPRLTWHRDLDLNGSAGAGTGAGSCADSGEVRWEDGALIEDGVATVFGAPVRYREVWRRMPGSDGPYLSLRPAAGQGRLVIVGDYALATLIQPQPDAGRSTGPGTKQATGPVSSAWQHRSGEWTVAGRWPPQPEDDQPAPGPAWLTTVCTGEIPEGWRVEFRGSS